MALTLASIEGLVPVTPAVAAAHPCLGTLPMLRDLRSEPALANRTSAWRWAIDTLLPRASTSTMMNLYHYDPHYLTDPQSHATLTSVDYAVQKGAFFTDLNPADPADALLLAEVFAPLSPLFDAYGWAHDEHAWTKAVSLGGGTVFCSFASPNLSFWALLGLDTNGGKARRLPSGDSKRLLNRSKYYVTFETNEGDTPRIVVSAFGSSWANPARGSIPVAWSVDPLLAERFPALMDLYAESATANDSFIGGVAGAGYVYLGALSPPQLEQYAGRVGRLFAEYGPDVADTYGQANFSVMTAYSRAAAANGVAPLAYVTQPLWAYSSYAEDAWQCPELNLFDPDTGTPVICTAHDPSLFYRNRNINQSDPGNDLADRIRTVASQYDPPFFITVYGGLKWTASATSPKTEFFTLMHATMADLGEDFVAIGASEMARLARAACADVPKPANGTAPTCAVAVQQRDCSPHPGPWRNSTQAMCEQLGCCWHWPGVRPTGHTCIHPEVAVPSCARRR
mmetsp:Transcript_25011/g.65223  ORF Transcript_25011/g.65223 Transcript_25011/m.65223 type:complete len:510 (-) Transcript_25011:223-1752(-)